MTVLQKILPVLEGLGHASVVAGILFVALEFVNQKYEQRQRNSLDFLQNFYSSEVTESRYRLQTYWFDKPLDSISGLSGSAGVIDTLAASQIFPSGSSPNTPDLIRVVEQLDIIGNCISTEVCDKKTVTDQLGVFAKSFLCMYRAPLETLRDDYLLSDLGRGASVLINGETGC